MALVVAAGVLGAVDRFIDSTALAPLRDTALYRWLNGFFSRRLLPWAVAVIAFFFVYKFVPASFVPARAALVASVVAGWLWEALKEGFARGASSLSATRSRAG